MESETRPLNRSVPPEPGPEKSNVFPQWQTHVLPNGLTCLIYENHDAELVDMRLVIKSGSINDGKKYELANLTGKMLMQGTQTRSASEIAEEADRLGLDLHIGVSADRITVFEDVLTQYLEEGLALMADVVQHPRFDPKELAFLKELAQSQIQASRSDGSSLASRAYLKAIYQEHPYGNPPEGTQEALDVIQTDDLKDFYSTAFLPENAFMVIAGDVEPKTMLAKLSQAFESWKGSGPVQPEFKKPDLTQSSQVILTYQEGAVQSTLYVGHLSVQRKHPDFIPLYVMNMVLGGYFGSRLNMNLREKKGFTYSIHSRLSLKNLAGDFGITLKVRTDATLEAIEELISEVKALQEELVGEDELQAAKRYIVGSFHIQNETPEAIASRMLSLYFFGLPNDYYSTYAMQIEAVSAEDILRVAKTYLHPEALVISVAGNKDSLQEPLSRLGEVRCLDAEGHLIEKT